MNDFYSICHDESYRESKYQLRNLGKEVFLGGIGTISRNDFGQRKSSFTSHYRPTTDTDYDVQFSREIIEHKPVYELEELIDFHLNYYINLKQGSKDTFVKHIKYIVLPLVEKSPNSKVHQDLINEWLGKNMTNKKENKGGTIFSIGDIKDSQVQINSDNSVQEINTKNSSEEIQKTFDLIREDIKRLNGPEREELSAEVDRAEERLKQGKEVKPRLLMIGELIKEIGTDVFTSLVSSPIYDMVKPLLGM